MHNVRDYGIVGNGLADDTAAIQSLIDLVNSLGGGVLYFPPGVYLLSIGVNGYALEPKPRVSLHGEYATFKLANAQGNYKALFYNHWTPVVSVDDVTIEGITFDMNAANNPVVYADGTAWIADVKPRMSLWLHRAKRFTVRDCRFTGIQAINTISVNGNGLGEISVQDVIIERCLFDNFGGSPIDHDYSAIYLHGQDCRVSACTFRANTGFGRKTPIETHGKGFVITQNTSQGMVNAAIIASPNTVVFGNVWPDTEDTKFVTVEYPLVKVSSFGNVY